MPETTPEHGARDPLPRNPLPPDPQPHPRLPQGSPRHERAIRLAFVAALVVVLVLSLLPPASLPPVHSGWDKADHALAWLALGLLGIVGWPRRAAWVLAGLLAYGGAIELLQGMTAWRQAEWADLLADAVGLAMAMVASWLAKALTGAPGRHR